MAFSEVSGSGDLPSTFDTGVYVVSAAPALVDGVEQSH